MNVRPLPRATLLALRAVCVLATVALLGLLASSAWQGHLAVEGVKAGARADADRAAHEIDLRMRTVAGLSADLAGALSSGGLAPDDVDARLQAAIKEHPEIFAVAVAFAPHALGPDVRLRSVSYIAKNGRHERVALEKIYDYSLAEHDWFSGTLEKGSRWLEPFFGKASNARLAAHCVPFSLPRPGAGVVERAGVVCASQSLDDLRGVVTSLDVGKTGYGFVVSPQGKILVHPRRDLAQRGSSVTDLGPPGDAHFARVGTMAASGQSGEIQGRNHTLGQRFWIFHRTIPSTGWTLGVVLFHREVWWVADSLRHQRIAAAICAVLAASAGALLILLRPGCTWRRRWGTVLAVSTVALAATSYLWVLERRRVPSHDRTPLLDRSAVAQMLERRAARPDLASQEPPTKIPTGALVQSIAFADPRTVVMSGWIWQRYPVDSPLRRGIVLPDWVPEQDVLTEAYRRREGDVEVVGWFFKATLREPFDSRKFPIDARSVRLRIRPADLDARAVLVPDLDGYRYVNPTALPGLAAGLSAPGWKTERSYFSYADRDDGVDFGLHASPSVMDEAPELSFDIELQRNLLDALIGHIVPLLVAAIMLFGMLKIGTRDPQKAPAFGFNTSTVVGTAAALFFVVLLSHLQMRAQLAAYQIVYLEWFYFVTYFLVLAVSVDAYVVASKAGRPFDEERDNVVPALLYWPLLCDSLFAVTAQALY
jgi:hypothetical protein